MRAKHTRVDAVATIQVSGSVSVFLPYSHPLLFPSYLCPLLCLSLEGATGRGADGPASPGTALPAGQSCWWGRWTAVGHVSLPRHTRSLHVIWVHLCQGKKRLLVLKYPKLFFSPDVDALKAVSQTALCLTICNSSDTFSCKFFTFLVTGS